MIHLMFLEAIKFFTAVFMINDIVYAFGINVWKYFGITSLFNREKKGNYNLIEFTLPKTIKDSWNSY